MKKKWNTPDVDMLSLSQTNNSTQPDKESDGVYGDVFVLLGMEGGHGTLCDVCS